MVWSTRYFGSRQPTVPINVAVEAPVVTEALTPVEADQLVADPATAAKRQPEKKRLHEKRAVPSPMQLRLANRPRRSLP